MPKTAPYGSWESPIGAGDLAAKAISLNEVSVVGDAVLWLEGRPAEGGRTVLVQKEGGGPARDVTPPPLDVRTRVHEYGGGAYAAAGDAVFFSHVADGRLYRTDALAARPLTAPGTVRYADFVPDAGRSRLIAVREDHAAPRVVNALVAVGMDAAGHGEILAAGGDFYAAPRLSPDGGRLAFLTWDHPRMPWDGTELMLAGVAADGRLRGLHRVAGGSEESILQPVWSPDGYLTFLSDRTGFWNLYRLEEGGVRPLCPRRAEFAGPAFRLGTRNYAYLSAGTIVAAFREAGTWRLGLIDVKGGSVDVLPLPYTEFSFVSAGPGGIAALAGSPTLPPQVVRIDSRTAATHVLKVAEDVPVEDAFLSPAMPITFPTAGGAVAHGYHYAPKNPDFVAPPGELAPLIVFVHGGPTSAARSALDLKIQFFTTRGLAVVDVDYRGSTGYGRAFREALKGRWGIADVEDVVAAARYLAARGEADPDRLAIRGGSAGGFTTLAALAFTDVFAAGASYFGVSDLGAFATDTHKFESHYLEGLVGPWPAAREVYEARSPLFHADDLKAPVIFFQGLDDRVVPPDQALVMVEALKARGVPVACITYAGEAHGFRRAESIVSSQEAELAFYGRVMGFRPAGDLPAVRIHNLP